MRIKKIEIQNFKFFGEKFELDVNCKNLLIYGENGSGKSSLYWALYTFFQSSIKNDSEIQKYFDKYNNQNLLNLDKQDDDSYIFLSLVEDNKTEDYKISIDNIDVYPNKYDKIKIANQSSDFISYRLTSRIYDFKNNEKIDLFSVFEKDILDFMIVDGVDLSKEWNIIKKGLEKVTYPKKTIHPGKNTTQYKEFKSKIDSFNDKFKFEINSIIKLTNDILKNKFNTDFEILLNYENCVYDDEEKKIINPKIILETLYNSKKIEKPHIFLNEAKLTTIALSIRFALLEKRLTKSELKILVLDDLLISLDMSNRMKVIDIVLNDYIDDYQLIILTHDKSFFKTIERKIKAKRDWKFYEFKTKENKLDFAEYKDDIEKAKECFKNKDFEQSALYLRKNIEETLKNFLDKEPTRTIKQEFESLEHLILETEKEIKDYLLIRLLHPYKKIFDKNISKQVAEIFINSIKSITFDEYSDNKQIKGYLLNLHFKLLDFLEELYDENSFVIEIKDELKELKDRVLNPSAHNSEEPLFEEEVNDAIVVIDKITKSLRKIKEDKEKQKSIQNINKPRN